MSEPASEPKPLQLWERVKFLEEERDFADQKAGQLIATLCLARNREAVEAGDKEAIANLWKFIDGIAANRTAPQPSEPAAKASEAEAVDPLGHDAPSSASLWRQRAEAAERENADLRAEVADYERIKQQYDYAWDAAKTAGYDPADAEADKLAATIEHMGAEVERLKAHIRYITNGFYAKAQQAEVERLTHERDGWREKASKVEKLFEAWNTESAWGAAKDNRWKEFVVLVESLRAASAAPQEEPEKEDGK